MSVRKTFAMKPLKTVEEFGRLDILVNNAAEQHPKESIKDITSEQLHRTFKTNFYSQFYLTKKRLIT